MAYLPHTDGEEGHGPGQRYRLQFYDDYDSSSEDSYEGQEDEKCVVNFQNVMF